MSNSPSPEIRDRPFRGIGAVASTQAALAAAAIVTDMLLGWELDRHSNGLFQAAYLVPRIVILAGALGIPTSLYVLFPKTSNEERVALFSQSFIILALAGLALGGMIFVAAPGLAQLLGQPKTAINLIQTAAFLIMTGLPALLAEPMLILRKRAWWAASHATVVGVIQCILIYLALNAGWGTAGVLYILAASNGLRLILATLVIVFDPTLSDGAGTADWKRSLQGQLLVALPIGITAAIDGFSVYADRAAVARWFSPESLALYRYAAQEVPFVGLLVGALTPVLLPRFSGLLAGGKTEEVLTLWHRATVKTAPILFGIFAALLWLAPELLTTLYSPQYREGARLFRIYLMLMPLRVITYLPMLYALNRGRLVAAVAAGEIVLSIGLTYFFGITLQWGLPGAALGAVVATIFQAVIYLAAIRKSLNVPWRSILPWRPLGLDLGLALVFFLPLATFRVVSVPAAVSLLIGMVWGAIYVAWRLGAFYAPKSA